MVYLGKRWLCRNMVNVHNISLTYIETYVDDWMNKLVPIGWNCWFGIMLLMVLNSSAILSQWKLRPHRLFCPVVFLHGISCASAQRMTWVIERMGLVQVYNWDTLSFSSLVRRNGWVLEGCAPWFSIWLERGSIGKNGCEAKAFWPAPKAWRSQEHNIFVVTNVMAGLWRWCKT